jgi:hypothetical protein
VAPTASLKRVAHQVGSQHGHLDIGNGSDAAAVIHQPHGSRCWHDFKPSSRSAISKG